VARNGERKGRSRSHRAPSLRHALALALLATVSLSACGGGDEDGDSVAGAPGASTPPPPSPSPAPGGQDSGEQDANSADRTPIRITFGDTELTARLHDNSTARDLAAQLPLTLTFRDLNNVEKTAPLPRGLSLEGAPEGDDPLVGDIGYWAPDGDLASTTATSGSGTASCGSASSTARWMRSSARTTTSTSRSNARNDDAS
jgi:hypothetical protein